MAFGARAQVSMYADSTDLLIGDQVKVYLRVQSTNEDAWLNKDISWPDTMEAIRIIQTGEVRTLSNAMIKEWLIGVYDTGVVLLPELPVVLLAGGGPDTLWSDSLPLSVEGVSDNAQELAPIKDIVREPKNLSDYLLWILIPAVVVILGLIVWILYKRSLRRSEPVEAEPEIVIPPHTLALDKLDALEQKKLWQQGEVKAYHSELNYIIREYIQLRFGIPALESVTSDILRDLETLGLDKDLEVGLRDMLMAEDLIKFAKAEPPVEVHAEYLGLARSLILKTKAHILSGGTEKEADHV
jgi:hypothetical protein